MLIKLKTVEEAVKAMKQELVNQYGYNESELERISQECLLDYIPEEYFSAEHVALQIQTEDGIGYLIGREQWAVNTRYVEYIVENGEKKNV